MRGRVLSTRSGSTRSSRLSSIDGSTKVFDSLNEEASQRYSVVREEVKRSGSSWKDLTEPQTTELEAIIGMWKQASEQGHGPSQFNLGLMYREGRGVKKSSPKAAQYYEMASLQNVPKAQFNLARMYQQGRGVKQSDELAFKWYHKAAGHNIVKAQFNLGLCYQLGLGVKQSDSAAGRWYQRGCENNDAGSQFNLGAMYEQGLGGLKKNNQKAYHLYKLAADQNYLPALRHLENFTLDSPPEPPSSSASVSSSPPPPTTSKSVSRRRTKSGASLRAKVKPGIDI